MTAAARACGPSLEVSLPKVNNKIVDKHMLGTKIIGYRSPQDHKLIDRKESDVSAETRWTRRNVFRGAIVASGVVAAPSLLSACSSVGGDPLAKIKDGEVVRIGLSNEPPYAFDDGGTVTGESVEMYTAILKELGAKDGQIETSIVPWNSLIPGLNAGDYDLITAGMFITPERCAEAIFSEPDYITASTLLVPKDNPNELVDYTSFIDSELTLGVVSGAVEKDQAMAAGVDAANIAEIKNLNDLKSELASGRIDAIALTAPALNYAAQQSGGEFETVEPFVPVIDGKEQMGAGGAVFRPADTAFRDAVNAELAKIKGDKARWLSITEPFGFTDNEFPAEQYTTESLCQGEA
ncbi:Extracellular solute-binding protein family 3 [Stackebrandtia soli]